MYILTRSLLVQVWSMKIQIKEKSKTKKIFERISGGLTDLFIRTNLECTFVHFCIFYLFYLNFSIKMALSSFFDIFET